MFNSATPQTPTYSQTPARTLGGKVSLGAKFFVILALAVVMSIPGFFMDSLADQRAESRHATVTWQDGNEVQPATAMGVKLVDSYRSIHRSLKYITLFLGLVFLTYFLFEVTTNKRLHVGQYALVGVAQTIFYLLLLSLSERVGFDFAFLIAGGATVTLFSVNAEWVFGNRKQSICAFAVFTLLYAFIYVLLRLEDYALLVGATASFLAVAVTMYLTRNIDWYSNLATPAMATVPPNGKDSWLE